MNELQLLQDLMVVMLVAAVATVLFHRLRQPVVLGYILAGVIIGPHTPPFPLINQESVYILEGLGLVILMFSLGLAFSLRHLGRVGPTVGIAGFLEIVLLVLLGFLLGKLFGWSMMDSLFLGAMLPISSTTIVVKTLQDLKLEKERFAQLIVGMTVMEDILAVGLLALLSTVAITGALALGPVGMALGKLVIFLTCLLVVGLLVTPILLRYVDRFQSSEILLISVLGLCFGVSLLAVKLQFSIALGAFLIGAIIAETRQGAKVAGLIVPLRDMFSAIFFVAIGMRIDPKLIGPHIGAILAITAVLIVGKTAACAFGIFTAGGGGRNGMRVGLSVAQIGEISFIIAGLGTQLGKTSDFLYPIAVSVSVISTLISPYLVRNSDKLVDGMTRLSPAALVDAMRVYERWVAKRQEEVSHVNEVRRLLRRMFIQILLNQALIAGVFAAATLFGERLHAYFPAVPAVIGGPGALLWLGTMLLCLPLYIASLRKLRAAAMLLAEATVLPQTTANNAKTIRNIITNIVFIAGSVVMILWMFFLSSAILPPIPIVIIMLLMVMILGLAARSWLIRIYAKAQVALRETLESEDGKADGS